MMVIIGIDPGISGAFVVLPDKGQIEFYDTPVVELKGAKKTHRMMDIPTIRMNLEAILKLYSGQLEVVRAVIEKVVPMPSVNPANPDEERRTMGATSAFNFGKGVGMWMGLLGGMQIPWEEVHPATWKSALMKDMPRGKDASRVKAMQLFPTCAKNLNLKKHHGRADALLMAAYGRMSAQRMVVPSLPQKELTLF